MLADPIDLRRTIEGELGARTHGNHGKLVWEDCPRARKGGEKGREDGDGVSRAKVELVVLLGVAEGLSPGLFIGDGGRFTGENIFGNVVLVLYGYGEVLMEIAEGIMMARKGTRERGGNGKFEAARVEDGGDARSLSSSPGRRQ
jgi:hypothetical protein